MAGDVGATALLPAAFRDPAARKATVERAAGTRVPRAVLDALARQNASPSAPARAHLDALSEPGTIVAVTGQQVGLFLGPLYTVYKAATAITVAAALQRETGRRCVPLFWLQAEDHDLAEINSATVATPHGETRSLAVNLPAAALDARVPVKHLVPGAAIGTALSQAEELLVELPHGAEMMALLRRGYRADASWPDAFSVVLRELFAGHGLLVVDPRDPSLAPLAAPTHRRALLEAAPIAEALEARSREMQSAGFEPQVHVRGHAPLSFYAPDAVDGSRFRLEPVQPGSWSLVGDPKRRMVTTDELLNALETQPARFSTSALLRPILQDSWFPTAAYVGGPAEMAYFAQLVSLYAHFGMPMPLAVPRARFRVLDPRTRSNLDALGLNADEASAPREAALATLAQRGSHGHHESPVVLEERLRRALLEPLVPLEETFAAVDRGLVEELGTTRAVITRTVGKLAGRYGRALAQRDAVTTARLDRVRAWLVPGEQPQERVHSVLYAAARFGGRAFVDLVVGQAEPFDGRLKDLAP